MTMSSLPARTCSVVVSSAVLTLLTATAAAAHEAPEPAPEPAPAVDWPPPDSEGEWLPVPPEAAEEYAVEACGTTVTVSPGDVFEVEYQSMHQEAGTVRVEYRGEFTVDVTRESDGAMLDELDVSGPGYDIFSADRRTITFSADGPSIIGAFDAVEAEVFAAQGLPPLFYYEEGNTTERVTFSADPAAATIESAEFLTDTARGVRDVCDMLDDADD
jgi:hypothetical protein